MGTRRPVDEVLNASPWHGWLAFNRPHPWGQPETDAVLTRPDERTRAMATLSGARVRRIEGGMLIDGQDQHVGGHPSVTAQVWAVGITEQDLRDLVVSICRKSEVVRIYWTRTKMQREMPS